jgi:large subunit ribosomal protein L15
MPHKLRRIRKTRGSRTQGYGRVGQHRDTGSRGYRKCGRHKAKWSYVLRYEPDYFGKNGFTSPKSLRQRVNAVNVGKLDEIASTVSIKNEKGRIVDLEKLGYTKLLGSGKVNQPLIVKVAAFSQSAAEKIKNAGGQILSEVKEEKEQGIS